MITVTKPSMPDIDEYINEIRDLWESKWLTNMGEKHQKFQKDLKKYLHVDNIELFTNGHMALELTLQALNLQGEVITTPFTFASTTHAIVRNGLKPVFCDINEDDFTIDVSKIEGLITENTTAILPVHVYGNVCDVQEIDRIAQKYNLKVVYDAAHAFGVTYKEKGIGQFGDASCFSFHATKVFNTIEGGACSFKDSILGDKLYQLKNFGIKDQETVNAVGANAKMNEFCAAMGICNLRHTNEERTKRERLAKKYRMLLDGIHGLKLNKVQDDVYANYAYFPVVIDAKEFGAGRDEVKEEMEKNGIGVRKYFFPLTNSFECFQGMFDVKKTPIAQKISQEVLTLPLYADLQEKDVIRVCEVLLGCRQ